MSENRDTENDATKPKGLFEALRELYGQGLKYRQEDIVEAAWKAVPKYKERVCGNG